MSKKGQITSLILLTILIIIVGSVTMVILDTEGSSSTTSSTTTTTPPLIGPDETGENSETYLQNYNALVDNALNDSFNTTISFSSGGLTYLTIPEFTTSTSCYISDLKASYNTSPVNWTHYELRSDLTSEAGLALAMSDNADAFHAWYNTLTEMDQCEYGVLPCWVILRDGPNLLGVSGANDTAIDGSVRAGLALYIAAQNGNFSSANRTAYAALADQIAVDSYQYETISIAPANTPYGTVTRLPMGGGDCAGAGLGCSVDMWTGYLGDIILFYLAAAESTGNATYTAIAANFTAAALSVSVQNDSDGDGFGVAPFNYNWDLSSGVGHQGGGGVNSWHYDESNDQWDDSDAPRFYSFCYALRAANLSDSFAGSFLNASQYCEDWLNSDTMTATTSCLQYYYNGTCSSSIRTGYYENGYGALLFMYHNTTSLGAKINETLGHYGFATDRTFDSTDCGTGLSYRGVRTTKSLGFSIGLDQAAYGGEITTSETVTSSDNSRFLRTMLKPIIICILIFVAWGTITAAYGGSDD